MTINIQRPARKFTAIMHKLTSLFAVSGATIFHFVIVMFSLTFERTTKAQCVMKLEQHEKCVRGAMFYNKRLMEAI